MKITNTQKIANKIYTVDDFSEEKIKTLSELKGILKASDDLDLSKKELKRLHKERIMKKNEDIS